MNDYLKISDTETLVVTQEVPVLLTEGIQGPPGPPGPQGPAGGGTGGSGFYYEFQQLTPLQTWVVNHNLGSRPNTTVYTVGGMQVFAEVQHFSLNQARIYFDQPATGFVICS